MNRWKSENNGPVLLKWLLYRIETIDKCVLLRPARMEMDSTLKTPVKTSGRYFQVISLMVEIKYSQNLI